MSTQAHESLVQVEDGPYTMARFVAEFSFCLTTGFAAIVLLADDPSSPTTLYTHGVVAQPTATTLPHVAYPIHQDNLRASTIGHSFDRPVRFVSSSAASQRQAMPTQYSLQAPRQASAYRALNALLVGAIGGSILGHVAQKLFSFKCHAPTQSIAMMSASGYFPKAGGLTAVVDWFKPRGCKPKDLLLPVLGTMLGYLALHVVDSLLAATVPGASCFVPHLGAVAVLLFCAPAAPFSQPRNVLLGHLVATLAAVLSFNALGTTLPLSLGRGASLATSIVAMQVFGALHPPAAAFAALYYGSAPLHDLGYKVLLYPGLVGAAVLLVVQKVAMKLIEAFSSE